ncbi:MAG: heme-binding protein [Planctomycetota bacterium]
MKNRLAARCVIVASVTLISAAWSVEALAARPQYGLPIDLATAKQVLAAAEAHAAANEWSVVIAIVDSGGHLVLFQRMDDVQLGSIELALRKAKTSAHFRRPSREFEERLGAGGEALKLLKLPEPIVPMEGGVPIVRDGKLIGAIGVSGVTSAQDGQIAAAGAAAAGK